MAASKPTVVLIHGFGFDKHIWDPILPAFDGFPVIHLSLPGFGESGIQGSYTITQLATFYWERLLAMGAGSFHLVGHSMGGYVVIEMAAQHADKLTSLSLIHSHVFEDPADRKKKRDEAIDAIASSGRIGFAEKMIAGMIGSHQKAAAGELIEALIARGVTADDNAWMNGLRAIRDRQDHGDTLKQLAIPVLLIAGEEDAAIPLDFVYKQATLAERCELHVLPGTGHLSMYEHPIAVTGILRKFLRENQRT